MQFHIQTTAETANCNLQDIFSEYSEELACPLTFSVSSISSGENGEKAETSNMTENCEIEIDENILFISGSGDGCSFCANFPARAFPRHYITITFTLKDASKPSDLLDKLNSLNLLVFAVMQPQTSPIT